MRYQTSPYANRTKRTLAFKRRKISKVYKFYKFYKENNVVIFPDAYKTAPHIDYATFKHIVEEPKGGKLSTKRTAATTKCSSVTPGTRKKIRSQMRQSPSERKMKRRECLINNNGFNVNLTGEAPTSTDFNSSHSVYISPQIVNLTPSKLERLISIVEYDLGISNFDFVLKDDEQYVQYVCSEYGTQNDQLKGGKRNPFRQYVLKQHVNDSARDTISSIVDGDPHVVFVPRTVYNTLYGASTPEYMCFGIVTRYPITNHAHTPLLQVRLWDEYTFGVHLSITQNQNMDFGGNTAFLFLIHDMPSVVESMLLMSVRFNMYNGNTFSLRPTHDVRLGYGLF